MARFKTDKEEPHGYLPDYEAITAALAPMPVICEIGVCDGYSLEMWQELRPDARVIGVDRDMGCRWPPGSIPVIATQEDPDLGVKVRAVAPDGCDLIVDDGGHIGTPTRMAYHQLWPLVRPGGCYVVEDWADPWVSPQVGVAHPGDRLVEFVPELITALKDGADRVTYTYEGLAIVHRRS